MSQLRAWPRWMLGVGAVLTVMGAMRLREVAYIVFRQWGNARGYEYEWVAGVFAQGHGYAFYSGDAWLGPYPDGSPYTVTAWVEPAQTLIMAAGIHVLGTHWRFALVLLNVFWVLAAAALIVYACGRGRIREGILAALAFLVFQAYVSGQWLYIGNTALAMCLFSLIAALLFRSLERLSIGRAVGLGAAVGLANLVHAGSLLFGLVAAVVLAWRFRPEMRIAWRQVLIVLVLPTAIVAPWTLRNYLVFEHVVPIRSGLGWNLYMGNAALGATLPDVRQSRDGESRAPWEASDARDAVDRLRSLPLEAALRGHAMEQARPTMPEDYQSYNEAERDAWFASLARAWMAEHPRLVSRFIAAKAAVFWFGWGPWVTLVTVLAALGVVLNWRDPRPVGLAMLSVAYAVPYVLAAPFYYRYRVPIDPFIFIGITFLLAWPARPEGQPANTAPEYGRC